MLSVLLLAATLTLPPDASTHTFDKGLQVEGVARGGRRPVNTDHVVAGMVDGSINLLAVKEGDSVTPEAAWKAVEANDGAFAPGKGATYLLLRVSSEEERVMMLDASGHTMVYVNNEPRMGDPYGSGYASLPIHLLKGDNVLLFGHAGRGPVRATLRRPKAELMISDRDLTFPDVLPGMSRALVAVPVVNAGTSTRTFAVTTQADGADVWSAPFTLAPCSIAKLPLAVNLPAGGKPGDRISFRVSILDRGVSLAEQSFSLARVAAESTHKRTFVSRIDSSVQYMSIVPPPKPTASPALVLSLHGASVEATSQAGSYAQRPDTVIACPTNRRPYGFDWEDWGRIDAIESMDLVRSWYNTDPTRQYLTGHSMGGHGTWNLGVLYPDRFAAIAPSAGWLSFDSYASAGGPPYAPDTAMGRVFQNARATSMTLDYFENLRGKGIFILHGDADDNVPVGQARDARAALDKLGIAYGHHEQPGAGHWWDDDKPGAGCLDWPAIWDTFAASRLEPNTKPAVRPPLDSRGFVEGTFKRLFDRSFTLVYSTAGSEAANAWSLAKARYDAEQWWYRGNGHARILSDSAFRRERPEGNVILYGNSETNRAWDLVMDTDAVISGGELLLAGRSLKGDNLACLMCVPRKDTPGALAAVIGGTGLRGMRAAERLNYFTSGTGFPGTMIFRADLWRNGFDSVEAAGNGTELVWK